VYPALRLGHFVFVVGGRAGDTIPLGADRMLRVIETRFVGEEPVLVVETS
jgi:hypothetical protein